MKARSRIVLAFVAFMLIFGGGAVRSWASSQAGDSRALAAMLFPEPAALGPDWVRPWEVPVSIPWLSVQSDRVSSEDAYWTAVEARLSEAFDSSAPSVSRLTRLRALCRPPAAALFETLRAMASRLRSTAEALRRAPGRTPEEKALAVMGTDAEKPAKAAGPSETEAASECRTLAASIGGYSLMTYLHAADWNAAAGAANPAELSASLDLLAVRVRYMNSPDAVEETGPGPEEANRLQTRLQGLLDNVTAVAQEQRALLGDRSSIPPLKASVRPLEQGDGSYLIQCFASGPSPGLPFPNVTSAWMRRENLITEVDLNGSMSQAEGEILVRSVLSIVDRSILQAGPDSIKQAIAGSLAPSERDDAHPVSPESLEDHEQALDEAMEDEGEGEIQVTVMPEGETVEEHVTGGGEDAQAETVSALGFLLGLCDGAPQVIAVEPESWAEKTSIRPGWVIFRVNEEPVAGLTLDKIRAKLLQSGRTFAVIDFIVPSGEIQRILLPLRQ